MDKIYADSRFIAIGDALLSYDGADKKLATFPSMLGGTAIKKVAEGAIIGLECEVFRFPEGIAELGPFVIGDCYKLRTIFLPSTLRKVNYRSIAYEQGLREILINSLEMDADKYREMERDSIKGHKDLRLVRTYNLDLEGIQPLIHPCEDEGFPYIPNDIPAFFSVSETEDSKEKKDSDSDCAFSIDYLGTLKKELNGIKTMLKKGYESYYDSRTETSEPPSEIKRTVLMTFYPEDTRFKGDKALVKTRLSIGFHFFQSLVPVTFNGKKYYVYRRCYLNDSTEIKYVVKDMAVVDNRGEIVKNEEASDVYGKYKLLSVL